MLWPARLGRGTARTSTSLMPSPSRRSFPTSERIYEMGSPRSWTGQIRSGSNGNGATHGKRNEESAQTNRKASQVGRRSHKSLPNTPRLAKNETRICSRCPYKLGSGNVPDSTGLSNSYHLDVRKQVLFDFGELRRKLMCLFLRLGCVRLICVQLGTRRLCPAALPHSPRGHRAK
jgi:hypothetical protein